MSHWFAGESPALGVWVKLAVPEVLEVLAAAADFVVLDCEHGPIDRRTMSTLVGVARGLGLRVFVRVSGHSPAEFHQALDAGVDGLVIPHVDDPATAARVVDACRFPPLGSRPGSLATRAGSWGRRTRDEYVENGNEQVMIIAQIESREAVSSVHEIGSTSGLDAIFIGPFDLSLSSGLDEGSAEFRTLIDHVESSPRTAALGGVAATPSEVIEMRERGYSFLVIGADSSLLVGAVRSFAAQVHDIAALRAMERS